MGAGCVTIVIVPENKVVLHFWLAKKGERNRASDRASAHATKMQHQGERTKHPLGTTTTTTTTTNGFSTALNGGESAGVVSSLTVVQEPNNNYSYPCCEVSATAVKSRGKSVTKCEGGMRKRGTRDVKAEATGPEVQVVAQKRSGQAKKNGGNRDDNNVIRNGRGQSRIGPATVVLNNGRGEESKSGCDCVLSKYLKK